MTSVITSNTSSNFYCEKCNFRCSKKGDYRRHTLTAKHTKLTPTYKKTHICACGKIYNHRQSLFTHKQKCTLAETHPPLENTFIDNNERDVLFEEMRKSYLSKDDKMLEMQNLIMLLMKNQQDVVQTLVQSNHEVVQSTQELVKSHQEHTGEIITGVVKALPPMGSTTNIQNNNTLNFYLTHTCKDAESIHDFTDRFVARSIEFFKDNFRQVASNQVDLAASVYNIMNKCLDEKPQNEKFIQTTDIKNGILYVKEKKKNDQRQLYGEAEFVKHMDGFEKTGTNLEHAVNKVFFPMKEEFTELMKYECGTAPNEDNYEDEDDFEDELYKYKERVMELKRNMCLQTYNTSTVFDKKYIRDEILARTKRHKGQSALE